MHDGRFLLMQVANCINNRSYHLCHFRPGKLLLCLVLPQCLQVRPLHIVHHNIDPAAFVIVEYMINTRQGRVMNVPEQDAIKGKCKPLLLAEAYDLFEYEHILQGSLRTLIIYKVDRARIPFTNQAFDQVTFSYECSYRKSGLYILHVSL